MAQGLGLPSCWSSTGWRCEWAALSQGVRPPAQVKHPLRGVGENLLDHLQIRLVQKASCGPCPRASTSRAACSHGGCTIMLGCAGGLRVDAVGDAGERAHAQRADQEPVQQGCPLPHAHHLLSVAVQIMLGIRYMLMQTGTLAMAASQVSYGVHCWFWP